LLTAIGQYVGGKVVTAILVVAAAGAGIWFWKHPEDLRTLWCTLKYAVVWIGFVLVLPWTTFFVVPWVVGRESNTAAASMLLGYLLLDVVVAVVLMGGLGGHGALTWFVLLLGFLSAAVYNFKACEYLAERVEAA